MAKSYGFALISGTKAMDPEHVQARQRARQHVAQLRKKFRDTGDHLFAWWAIRECRSAKVALPRWLWDFIDGEASRPRQASGGRRWRYARDATLAAEVERRIKGPEGPTPVMQQIYEAVARDHAVTWQSVRRAHARLVPARFQKRPRILK